MNFVSGLWLSFGLYLSPNARYVCKRAALQVKEVHFPFLPLFMSWHWLTLVFTDLGGRGVVASFCFTSSYL